MSAVEQENFTVAEIVRLAESGRQLHARLTALLDMVAAVTNAADDLVAQAHRTRAVLPKPREDR